MGLLAVLGGLIGLVGLGVLSGLIGLVGLGGLIGLVGLDVCLGLMRLAAGDLVMPRAVPVGSRPLGPRPGLRLPLPFPFDCKLDSEVSGSASSKTSAS